MRRLSGAIGFADTLACVPGQQGGDQGGVPFAARGFERGDRAEAVAALRRRTAEVGAGVDEEARHRAVVLGDGVDEGVGHSLALPVEPGVEEDPDGLDAPLPGQIFDRRGPVAGRVGASDGKGLVKEDGAIGCSSDHEPEDLDRVGGEGRSAEDGQAPRRREVEPGARERGPRVESPVHPGDIVRLDRPLQLGLAKRTAAADGSEGGEQEPESDSPAERRLSALVHAERTQPASKRRQDPGSRSGEASDLR